MTLRTVALCILTLIVCSCGKDARGYPTPSEGAKAYLQALVDGDTAMAHAMNSPISRDPAYNMGEEESPVPSGDITSFTILDTVEHGQFATVDADVILGDGTKHLYRLMLLKHDNSWMLGRRAWMAEAERR